MTTRIELDTCECVVLYEGNDVFTAVSLCPAHKTADDATASCRAQGLAKAQGLTAKQIREADPISREDYLAGLKAL